MSLKNKEEMLTQFKKQCSKLPPNVFLWPALVCICASVGLKCMKKNHFALFMGQCAVPFLLLGIYKKLDNPDPNSHKEEP